MRKFFRKKMSKTEEKEQSIEEQQDAQTVEDNNEEQEQPTETVESDPMEELKQEVGEWKDKYMRLHAEFDNFRKRTQRERVELLGSASAGVLKQMLPTLDDLDRAIQANQNNEDLDAVKEGFELIANKMLKTLEAQGLKPMDAKGKPFDVDHHEAITKFPAPTEDMKGKVVDVTERGYFLNDKVLRYAKVVVGE